MNKTGIINYDLQTSPQTENKSMAGALIASILGGAASAPAVNVPAVTPAATQDNSSNYVLIAVIALIIAVGAGVFVYSKK